MEKPTVEFVGQLPPAHMLTPQHVVPQQRGALPRETVEQGLTTRQQDLLPGMGVHFFPGQGTFVYESSSYQTPRQRGYLQSSEAGEVDVRRTPITKGVVRHAAIWSVKTAAGWAAVVAAVSGGVGAVDYALNHETHRNQPSRAVVDGHEVPASIPEAVQKRTAATIRVTSAAGIVTSGIKVGANAFLVPEMMAAGTDDAQVCLPPTLSQQTETGVVKAKARSVSSLEDGQAAILRPAKHMLRHTKAVAIESTSGAVGQGDVVYEVGVDTTGRADSPKSGYAVTAGIMLKDPDSIGNTFIVAGVQGDGMTKPSTDSEVASQSGAGLYDGSGVLQGIVTGPGILMDKAAVQDAYTIDARMLELSGRYAVLPVKLVGKTAVHDALTAKKMAIRC